MTDRAVLRKARLHVIGILRAREILQVTASAVHTGKVEIPVDVAGRAVERGVHSGQREASELGVVEGRPQPAIHVVAGLAGGRETGRHMIRKLCLRKRLRVTGNAIRGEALKLANRCAFVAIVAGKRGMRAYQRKAVQVCAQRLKACLPARRRVAAFAVGAELPPVNVRVTVRALGPDVGENHADVALRAGNTLVQAAQRVARPAVVKLQNVAEGLPGCEGVAILAGEGQLAVWTASDAGFGRLGRSPSWCQNEKCASQHQQGAPHRDLGPNSCEGCTPRGCKQFEYLFIPKVVS